MNNNLLAEIFIDLMPVMVGLKTLAFFTLWFMLWQQDSDTTLGRWTTRFFLATFLTSLLVTFLSTYLAKAADPEDITGPVEWFLVIGLTILPLLTTWCGYKVAVWTTNAKEYETKDQRDERQDNQQRMLDETSIILTARGNKLSESGAMLDQRRVDMDIEQESMDREHQRKETQE